MPPSLNTGHWSQIAERDELAALGCGPAAGGPEKVSPPWAGLVDSALAAGVAAGEQQWLHDHIGRLRAAIEKQLERHF